MKKRQTLVRALALVLVLLLIGGTVTSVLVGAFAEDSASSGDSASGGDSASNRDAYEIQMEYLEDEQALHVTQRLVYHNRMDFELDRVVFCAAANMFRRESALCYESDVLQQVFPEGFAPAGIDLRAVRCDGSDADWGYVDDEEIALRVACALAPGASCTFEFDYYLLLGRNRAMTGVYDTDVRLDAFYFVPGLVNEIYQEFVVNAPIQFTRWLLSEPADYRVTLTAPDLYLPAATGSETLLSSEDHVSTWLFEAQNVREFALSFGKRYREFTAVTPSGVTVRLLTNRRDTAGALDTAVETISLYEQWLGDFPVAQIDLVQSDYPVGALNFPGAIWLPESLFDSDAAMGAALRFCLAQQYVGIRAYPEPVSDAWLSDVPSSYLALLAVEETDGYAAFVDALNGQVLDSLRITIPGGLYVTADAGLFTSGDYELIVLGRGTVVMHELRLAMGREDWLEAIRIFYEKGLDGALLGEMDFLAAFDEATGGDWEKFLTDWLFNVDDYIDQQIERYE